MTCACRGASAWYFGAGIVSTIVWNSGSRFSLFGRPPFSGISMLARPFLAEA